MPDILYTGIFEGKQRGWTESYAGFQSSGDLALAVTNILPWWQQRAAMLGVGCRIKAIKASAITDKGDSYLIYVNMTGNSTEAVNDFESSVNVQLSSANGRYKKLVFLRGAWDVVFNDANFNNNQVAWISLYTSWRQGLLDRGLGWMGISDNPPQTNVEGYTQATSGIITFALGGDIFAPEQLGKKREVRFSGMGQKSVLNRVLVVIPLTASTCKTTAPIAAPPYQDAGFCTNPSFERRTAQVVNLQRIGRRPAGAPLLEPVGRGRNRARY